jgi:hypothetical protein
MYLPRKPLTEIGKGCVIYSPENSSDRLYLVVRGRVTVKTTEEGYETISRILCTEARC